MKRHTLITSSRPRHIATLLLLGAAVWTAGAQAADPRKGAAIYNDNCVNCHGQRGAPTMPGLPDFSRGERLMQNDLELIKTISRGKGMMPAYQGLLSENDILDVIAHLRTLR